MHRTQEFRAKTAEFDRRLLGFFEDWKSFVEQHRDGMTLTCTNWLEDFCSYVWDSLIRFQELGRLKGSLGSSTGGDQDGREQ